MKKLPCLITAFLVLLAWPYSMAIAEQQDRSIERCNELYHNSAFEDAITCYRSLLDEGHSANILYNIGNSYAQLDQTGYSILYFMRALSIDPADSDSSGNLAMIKKEKGLFPPEKSAVQVFFNLLTLGQWSVLCLLAAAGYLAFACTRLGRKKNNLLLEAFILCLCLIFLSAGVLGARIRYNEWHQSVVVRDSRLLISPFENGASIGAI
ncbi:MAG: tetratricopeptide repeat protein, partial [Desulfocapsaceae bacterium]|nr:tetratricopeptide repeat protein [Desulfocapsaceae bacterium]